MQNDQRYKNYSDSKALSHYYCLLLGFLMQQSESYKAIVQLWINKYRQEDFTIILQNIKQFWQYYQKMANYYQSTQQDLSQQEKNDNSPQYGQIGVIQQMFQNSQKHLETIQAIFQIVQIRNNSIVQNVKQPLNVAQSK